MVEESIQLAEQLLDVLSAQQNLTLAVSTQNGELVLRLVWACLAAGIQLAFLPTSNDPVFIEALLDEIEASFVVTDSAALQEAAWAISFEGLWQNGRISLPSCKAPDLDTPAFLFQTSGTTGTPKWVQVTHGQFTAAITSMKEEGCLNHAADAVAYITQPLTHSYGLSSALEYSAMGASLVLPATLTGLGPVTHLINSPIAAKITAVEGVPYFYTQMSRLVSRMNLPNLSHIGFGGGKLDQPAIDTIKAYYPALTYSVRYGLTETPSVVSHKLFLPPYADNWNSSGKILSIYDLQIVDEAGHPLPAGQEGEIHIAGTSLAWPYFGETAVSPYFATGDIGYIHPQTKELHIVGRQSAFLKIRGYRISPETVESAINNFADVLESRVSEKENRIVAEVVRTTESVTEQTLQTYLATKLPNYTIPETITFVDTIPKTNSGKIKRH